MFTKDKDTGRRVAIPSRSIGDTTGSKANDAAGEGMLPYGADLTHTTFTGTVSKRQTTGNSVKNCSHVPGFFKAQTAIKAPVAMTDPFTENRRSPPATSGQLMGLTRAVIGGYFSLGSSVR